MGQNISGTWEHYDPHLPELIEDPYPAYVWLREHSPVHYVESTDVWALSRYDDILAAARDDDVFSNKTGLGFARATEDPTSLTQLDRPHHTRLRRQLMGNFARGSIDTHRARAVALMDEQLDLAMGSRETNFASTVSTPYLSRLVGEWMGIPDPDIDMVNQGSTAASLVMAGDFSNEVMGQLAGFGEYFEAMATREEADREAGAFCPGTERTLSDVLLTPAPDGYELTHAETSGQLALLAVGGNETTAQFFSAAAIFLAERPDIFDQIRADRSLIPAATEEMLRYLSPVQGLFRSTTRAVSVGGREIPADAKVLLLYASGNHDPAHYEAPDEFRIDRFPRGVADSDHLSFTTGVHICLGAHLARMMVYVFLNRLADRVKRIEIAGPVQRSHNALVRVIDNLPVRLEAA